MVKYETSLHGYDIKQCGPTSNQWVKSTLPRYFLGPVTDIKSAFGEINFG